MAMRMLARWPHLADRYGEDLSGMSPAQRAHWEAMEIGLTQEERRQREDLARMIAAAVRP